MAVSDPPSRISILQAMIEIKRNVDENLMTSDQTAGLDGGIKNILE